MVPAPQRDDSDLTCTFTLLVMVNTSSEAACSGWWRSATLTAGPCVSLSENRKPARHASSGWGAAPLASGACSR
jgi:hypothetical protein